MTTYTGRVVDGKVVLDGDPPPEGTEVAVLVSGLGATPLNELYILNDTIESEISARGLTIVKTWIGNYFTSLEMVGATLTVMALAAKVADHIAESLGCGSGT